MKKFLFLSILLASFSFASFAQKGYFPCSEYKFDTIKVGTANYKEIIGSTLSSVLKGKSTAENVTLPWSFNYSGENYTQIRICSNGWIMFGGSSATTGNNDLKSTLVSNALFPLWGNLSPETGEIRYQQNIINADTMFIIQWKNIKNNSGTESYNFQVVLYKGSNIIEFRYGAMAGSGGTGPYSVGMNSFVSKMSVGSGTSIQDSTRFISVIGSGVGQAAKLSSSTTTANNQQAPQRYAGFCLRFTPPACPSPGLCGISSLLSTSAVINFAKSGNYTLQYKRDTAISWTTIENVKGASYPLTGLTPYTNYIVRVKIDCNDNYSFPTAFTTPINPPWFENFTGNINPETGLPYGMVARVSTTSSNKTFKIEEDNNYQTIVFASENYLISPAISLKKDSSYRFSFKYRREEVNRTSANADIIPSYGTTQDISAMTMIPDKKIYIDGYGTNEYIYYYCSYTAQETGIYYFGVRATTGYPLHFTDLKVERTECPDITDIVVGNGLTPKDITIKLDADKNLKNFIVEYREASGSSTWKSKSITTDSTVITVDKVNTSYEFRAKVDGCASAGYTVTKTISSKCELLESTLPIYETFDQSYRTPCWTTVDATNTSGVIVADMLISPLINKAEIPVTALLAKFSGVIAGGDASGGRIFMGIVTNIANPDSSFIVADTLYVPQLKGDNLTPVTGTLSSLAEKNIPDVSYYAIAFKVAPPTGDKATKVRCFIDNMQIERNYCNNYTVSNIVLASSSDTVLNLTWDCSGNASGYKVSYKPLGDAAWTNFKETTTKSVQITGLTAATRYMVSVQAKCDGSGNFGVNNYFTTETDNIIDLSTLEEHKWVDGFENPVTFVRTIPSYTKMVKNRTDINPKGDKPYLLRRSHSGNGYLEVDERDATKNQYIYTPKIKMEPGKTYRFSFWHAYISPTSSRKMDSLQVTISDDRKPDDSEFGSVKLFGVGSSNKDSLNTYTYQRVVVDYTYNGQSVAYKLFKINCKSNSDVAPNYGFDNFEIYEQPANPSIVKTRILKIVNSPTPENRNAVIEVPTGTSYFYARYRKEGMNWSEAQMQTTTPEGVFDLNRVLGRKGEVFDTGTYEFQLRYVDNTLSNSTDWTPIVRASFSPIVSAETVPFKQNFTLSNLNTFGKNFNALSNIKGATQCLGMSAPATLADSTCGIFIGSKNGDTLIFIGPAIDSSKFQKLYAKVTTLSSKSSSYIVGFVGNPAEASSSFTAISNIKSTGNSRIDSISFAKSNTKGNPLVYLAFKVFKDTAYNFILNSIEIDTIKPKVFSIVCNPVNNLTVSSDEIGKKFIIDFVSQNPFDSLINTQLSYKSAYQDIWNTKEVLPTSQGGNAYRYEIGNISKGSFYEIGVLQNCKNGLTSSSARANAGMNCGSSVETLPYAETFENGFPICWKAASVSVGKLQDEIMENSKTGNPFGFKNYLNNPSNLKAPSILVGSGARRSYWLFSPKIHFDFSQSPLQLYFLAGLTTRNTTNAAIKRNDGTSTADTVSIYLIKKQPIAGISIDSLLKESVTLRIYSSAENAFYGLYRDITNNGTQISIPLTSVPSGDYYIAFNSICNYGPGFNDLFITNVGTATLPRCPATMNVRTNSVQSKTATVRWTENDKESYTVHYGKTGTEYRNMDSVVIGGTINRAKLSGLDSLTQYQVYVGSSCSNGLTSDLSAPLTFSTTAPCIKPLDPVLISTGETFAVIRWEDTTSQTTWQVQYKNTATSEIKYKMVNSNNSIVIDTIKNLAPNTSYSAMVRSVCAEEDSSDWTGIVIFTTDCMGTKDPKSQSIQRTQATLKWKSIPSQTKWQIEFGTDGFDIGTGTIREVNNTNSQYSPSDSIVTYILTGLTKATTYNVYISGICERGSGQILAASSFVKFNTIADCASVTDVEVAKPSSDVANVTWTPGEANTTWKVEYGYENFKAGKGINTYDVTVSAVTLTGLEQGVKYEITVKAFCEQEPSNWSLRKKFLEADILETLKKPEAKFIPNPASSYTVLSLKGITGKVSVKIFDTQGKLLQTETVNCSGDCEEQIQLNKLAPGSYTVQIISEKFVTVQKLMVR